jgi:post-segregation antitoxin (ccd killing protein)
VGTRSIYLPDDVDDAARRAGLDVNALSRRAVERELARRQNEALLEGLQSEPPLGASDADVRRATDSAKDDW